MSERLFYGTKSTLALDITKTSLMISTFYVFIFLIKAATRDTNNNPSKSILLILVVVYYHRPILKSQKIAGKRLKSDCRKKWRRDWGRVSRIEEYGHTLNDRWGVREQYQWNECSEVKGYRTRSVYWYVRVTSRVIAYIIAQMFIGQNVISSWYQLFCSMKILVRRMFCPISIYKSRMNLEKLTDNLNRQGKLYPTNFSP